MKAFFWLSVLSQFLKTNAQAQQVIACPEQLGGAPQPCVNEQCGNEDPANQGHCVNRAVDGSQCVCDPAATTTVPLATSLVTAPASKGATGAVTATFALATLTQYTDLHESIAATITVAPTQTGEPAATVAALVFAGGVAWYLAGVVGGEAAAVTSPKDGGIDHQNDETCAGDRPKCNDCGATLGFCVTLKPGCACEEEKKCPEQRPACEAPECGGDNGICTLGDLNECECSENNACPDDIDAPFCSTCGGEEIDTTQCLDGPPCCKGGDTTKDTGFNYKGCSCYQDDGLDVFGFQNPVDPLVVAAWWEDIQTQEDPICQRPDPHFTEVTAPQHIIDGDPSVEKAAQEWCASMDGQTVKDGGKPLYNFNKYGVSSFWLSASYRNSAPAELNCGNEAKIVGDDCVKSMITAVERCEPHQKMTHGAAIGNGCVFYNVTLSGLTDPDRPPWAGNWGKPKCDDKVSNIERNFFAGVTPQFCSKVKDGNAIKETLTNKDFIQPFKGKRAPPPSGTQYEGFKFNFEFSGGEDCQMSCDDAFEEMLAICTGQNTMRYKGSIDAGCGTYSYSIEDPPPPPPPKQSVCKPLEAPAPFTAPDCTNCRQPYAGYPRSAYQAGAHQLCYGGYDVVANPDDTWSGSYYFWFDTTTIDPNTNLPTYCIGSSRGESWQIHPESGKNCKAHVGGLGFSDSKIELMILPAKDQTGCKPLKEHRIPKEGDCAKIFDKISEECITGEGTDESGGYYLENSEDGCWEWWHWGSRLT